MADVAEFLAPTWGVPAEAVLAVPVDQARGHLAKEALADTSLTWEEGESGSGARVFRAALGEFEAELSVGDVARTALLYGRTPAEAATLEAQRLGLKLSTSALTRQVLKQSAAATVVGATT